MPDRQGLAVDTPATREAQAAGRQSAKTLEQAHELGYFGSPSDPRPNADYTLAGVSAGLPAEAAVTITHGTAEVTLPEPAA